MILTKTEFKEMFGFKYASSVCQLLKNKRIVANDSKMIDLKNPKNKRWVNKRKKKLKEKGELQNNEKDLTKITEPTQKDASYIVLKVDLLNLKLEREGRLLELPHMCANEVFDIFKTSDSPKEEFVKFFTDKMHAEFKNTIEKSVKIVYKRKCKRNNNAKKLKNNEKTL